MIDPTEKQPALPGLDLESLIGGVRGSLRRAVEHTIDALADEKLLSPVYTAQAQLALTLADAVERSAMKGQAAACAMSSAQLLAALDALPKPVDADTADRFAQLVARLEVEANRPASA